jgi:glycolate oxidase FAD binding subunit
MVWGGGYDLAKLLTGSLGTLGVIVKAIFRLHPKPQAERLVEAEVRTPAEVGAAVQRLLHSILVPSAIELFWPLGGPGRIGVLLSGVEPGVVAQSATAMSLLETHSPATIEADAGAELDRRYQDGEARIEGGLTVKITCLPTNLAAVLDLVERAAKAHGGRGVVTGRAGSGVLELRLDETDPQRAATLVQAIRAGVRPGHVTVLDAPVEVKRQLDVWGPVGDAEDLMRRVKARFDPDGCLNPGRFVGGI